MKTIEELLEAGEYFSEQCLLKSRKETAIHIINKHYQKIFNLSMHHDTRLLSRLVEFANTKDPTFYAYLNTFTNFDVSYKNGVKAKAKKNRCPEDVEICNYHIDFYTFQKICRKKTPTLEEIKKLKKDLEKGGKTGKMN